MAFRLLFSPPVATAEGLDGDRLPLSGELAAIVLASAKHAR
jgi:hypothetical protein